MATLYGMRQSPWTEKARWALDHHGFEYEYKEHVPLIGELRLRRHAGGRKASVPMLVDGETILPSSIAIARHGERGGRGAPLFPKSHEEAIAQWNDVADAVIGVGRVRVLKALTENPEAQREALPGFIPGALRGVLGASSSMAARYLASKYEVPSDLEGETEETLRPALARVRESLGGRPYLLDGFSFADLAIATALGAVRPTERLEIGPATRAAWTSEPIAEEFGDLLMWRDAIYAKHR